MSRVSWHMTLLIVVCLGWAFPCFAQFTGWKVQTDNGITDVVGATVLLAQQQAGRTLAVGPQVAVTAGANLALKVQYTAENLTQGQGVTDHTELLVTVTWYDAAGVDVDQQLLALGFSPVKRIWVLTKNSVAPLEMADNLTAPSRAVAASVSIAVQMTGAGRPAKVQVRGVTLAPGQVTPSGFDMPDSGPADAGPLSSQPIGYRFGPNLVRNGALEEGETLPTGWRILGDNAQATAVWKQGGAYSGKRCLQIIDREPFVKSWENTTDLYIPGGAAPNGGRANAREEVSARFASDPSPVEPGALYQASSMLWVLNHSADFGCTSPLRMQFLDAQGKVLPYHAMTDDWYTDRTVFTRPGWQLLVTQPVSAPRQAKSVRVVVALTHALCHTAFGTLTKEPEGRGFVLLDNIALYRVPVAATPHAGQTPALQYDQAFRATIQAQAMPYVPSSPAHRPNSLRVESLTDHACGILIAAPGAGGTKGLALHLTNLLGDVRPLALRYDIVDWQERAMYSSTLKVTLPPFGERRLPIDRPANLPYGPYTLRYSVFEAAQLSDSGESRFALLRPNGATFVEKGRMDYPFASWAWVFGKYVEEDNEENLRELGGMLQAAGVGKQGFCTSFNIGSLLNDDVQHRHRVIEEQIARVRKVYSALQRYGMHPIGFIVPPNSVVPPSQYPQLTETIRSIVTAMKDQVKVWSYSDELINGHVTDLDVATKPDGTNMLGWYRKGTGRQFWSEYLVCYEAAKQADPSCLFGPSSASDASGNVLRLFFSQISPKKQIDNFSVNMFGSVFNIWPPQLVELKKVGLEHLPLMGQNFVSYQASPMTGPGRYKAEAEAVRRMTTYWVEALHAFPQLFFVPQWGTTLDDEEGSFTYLRRVRPQYVAYANMTDCLGSGTFTAKYETPGGVVFVRERTARPGLVGVLWATGVGSVAELEVGVPSVEIRDVWGNQRSVKTEHGIVSIPLTPMPQYLLGAKVIKPTSSVTLTLANTSRNPRDPQVTVTITNARAVPITGTLILQPESAIAIASATKTLEPIPGGTTRTVTFQVTPIDAELDMPLALRARLTTPQRVYETVKSLNFHCAVQVATPPTIDGNLTDWSTECPFVANREDQLFKYQNKKPWEGPQEFSGRLWMRWDAQSLYLAARVQDQGFAPATSLEQLWASDAIEMLLDLTESSQKTGAITQIALGTFAGQGHIYRYGYDKALPIGDMANARIVVKRIGQETVYEAAIPWEELSPTFRPRIGATLNTVFGFNDADDGVRMLSWYHKVAGMDKNTFGSVKLVAAPVTDAAGDTPPRNLLANGDFDDPALPPDPTLKSWHVVVPKDKQGGPRGKAMLTTDGAYAGQSLCLESQLADGQQLSVGGWRVPVHPGEVYLVRAMSKTGGKQVVIECRLHDAQNREIHRMASMKVVTPSSEIHFDRMLYLVGASLPDHGATYAPMAAIFEIPADATWLDIGFSLSWEEGKIYFDHVELYRLI